MSNIQSSRSSHPYATAYTRTGKLNMHNRKPYRTDAQRREARRNAEMVGGRYVSNAPVSYHRAPTGRTRA